VKSCIPVLLCASLFSTVVGACNGSTNSNALPGTPAGTFNVVGTLGTNTCGTGLGLSNPWDFQLQLSVDGTVLYLAATDGSSQMSGPIIGTSASLTASGTANVDATDAGAGLCDLTLTATFNLDLNSGTSPTRFTGSVSYAYAVASGVASAADCNDQLTSSGGHYAALPCNFTYSLSGTQ
jgi:hypothetical protein